MVMKIDKRISRHAGQLLIYLMLFMGGSVGFPSLCGSDDSSDDDPQENGGETSGFKLKSSEEQDGFNRSAAIPKRFACSDLGGDNDLPTLTWANDPDATRSFALVMKDTSTDPDTIHLVVFDIANGETQIDDRYSFSATNSAPNYAGNRGYAGPCPTAGEDSHTYEFVLYALDVMDLVDETGANASSADDVITKIEAHDLASASLSGTFSN
jgi:Raf kinase inhibitor-like YbhB/YbcL family protein